MKLLREVEGGDAVERRPDEVRHGPGISLEQARIRRHLHDLVERTLTSPDDSKLVTAELG